MEINNRLYDWFMYPLEVWRLARMRREIVRAIPGRCVLEIGIGTGLNLRHYPDSMQVVGIEPYYDKLTYSRERHPGLENIFYVQADAQELPFTDHHFDAVIGTLVFCTIPDPVQAFREIERVIKPAGYIRILEHVRIAHPLWGKLQDLLTPVWKPVAGGCHLNRETDKIAQSAGLVVKSRKSFFQHAVLDLELATSGTTNFTNLHKKNRP